MASRAAVACVVGSAPRHKAHAQIARPLHISIPKRGLLMQQIHLVAQTGSTNEDVRAQSKDWPEGDWLRAERQIAGRGRRGRQWESPTGNLYASTLIRLKPHDPPIAGLSLMVGVAVHAALVEIAPGAAVMLKWPNDVMVGSAKLSGMLLEREGDCIIVGVGINVTHAPRLEDRETIALADLRGGQAIDAQMLMQALAHAFDHWLARWREGGSPHVNKAWLERAHPIGTSLLVSTGPDSRQQGRFLGLDGDGALILEREDGTSQLIHSGDVGMLT